MSNFLGTTHIRQFCVVCDDIERIKRNWANFFGVDVPITLPSEEHKYTKTIFLGEPAAGASCNSAPFEFGAESDLELEIIRPVGRVPSEWENYFVSHGPGIHHIAFGVRDIPNKIIKAAELGIICRQQGYFGRGSGRYAYMGSQQQLKTTIELVENLPIKVELPPDAPIFNFPVVPHEKRPTRISLVVNDIETVIQNYFRVFGVEPVMIRDLSRLTGVKTFYKGNRVPELSGTVAIFDFESIELEFVEPGLGRTTWRECIDQYGEGAHHLSFKTQDFDASLKECQLRGWEVIQCAYRDDGTGLYACLDSTYDLGCLIEIHTNQ